MDPFVGDYIYDSNDCDNVCIEMKRGLLMGNIITILVSVLLNCAAQLLMRKGMIVNGAVEGMGNLFSSIPSMITNLYLWGAMFCYGVSIVIWMVVLSKVEVSYAYPFLSIGYVLSAIAGYAFFSETISPVRVAGIIVICIGVILISRS